MSPTRRIAAFLIAVLSGFSAAMAVACSQTRAPDTRYRPRPGPSRQEEIGRSRRKVHFGGSRGKRPRVRPMQRRTFLKGLALAGGGLALRPALASALGGLPGTTGASRRSRLDPSGSLRLVRTDLHNHSFISGDAEGD